MPTANDSVRYTLTDGSIWTAVELGEHLGLTATAARYRLNQSDNVTWVMRKHFVAKGRKKAHTCKKFTLDDGSTMSAEGHAKKYNVNLSTIYARLGRGIRDVASLSRKPTQGRRANVTGYTDIQSQPMVVREMVLERNYYDPLSRLFLKMNRDIK